VLLPGLMEPAKF